MFANKINSKIFSVKSNISAKDLWYDKSTKNVTVFNNNKKLNMYTSDILDKSTSKNMKSCMRSSNV